MQNFYIIDTRLNFCEITHKAMCKTLIELFYSTYIGTFIVKFIFPIMLVLLEQVHQN